MSEQQWLNIFSENLKSLMKDARITQIELAEEIGVTQSVISDYVNGRKLPGIKSIINMSYALGCDLYDFIDFGEMIE